MYHVNTTLSNETSFNLPGAPQGWIVIRSYRPLTKEECNNNAEITNNDDKSDTASKMGDDTASEMTDDDSGMDDDDSGTTSKMSDDTASEMTDDESKMADVDEDTSLKQII
jgi:hypothetical protein